MSKPIVHAKSSAARFGGRFEDYLPIHDFMDSSKATLGDVRHRALLHHTFGCFVVEKAFGHELRNSAGLMYSPRDIAEQHILEDLGTIPTVNDYFDHLVLKEWMGGGKKEDVPSRANMLRKNLKELQNELANLFKLDLIEALKKTGHKAVQWVQYTPYFNDGDHCTFNIYSDGFCNTDISFDEDGEPIYDEDDWEEFAYKDPFGQYLSDNKGLLENEFGDGVRVVWLASNQDNFYIDTCDHD